MVDTNELDSITAATGIDTGEFVSAISTPEEPRITLQKPRQTRQTRQTKLQRKRKRNEEDPKPLLRRSKRTNKPTPNQRPRRTAAKQKFAKL